MVYFKILFKFRIIIKIFKIIEKIKWFYLNIIYLYYFKLNRNNYKNKYQIIFKK